MAIRESTFGRSFADGIRGDVLRVENTARPGTPDSLWSKQGLAAWVEFKTYPFKHPRNLDVRPEQYVWALRHARSPSGLAAFLLVNQPHELWLLPHNGALYEADAATWRARCIACINKKEKHKWLELESILQTHAALRSPLRSALGLKKLED